MLQTCGKLEISINGENKLEAGLTNK